MKKLNITCDLIQNIVKDITPLIENLTQWQLRINTLRILVLPKNQGYEEVILGRLRGAGILIDKNHPRSIIEKLLEHVIEANILGAYQPGTQEIIIIRENVDESNIDGLKLIIGHELVHRGQHLYFKHLFDQVDERIKNIFGYINSDMVSLKEITQEMEKIRPIMSLIESHAYYIQNVLKQNYFPEAKIESHFNVATVLMSTFGKAKTSQYTEKIPEVSKAFNNGTMDSLYLNL